MAKTSTTKKSPAKRAAPRPAFNWKAGAALAGSALVGLGIAYVLQEKATPGPDYRVLVSERGFEVRAYPAITVAETVVRGGRKNALSEGFRRLADYIFAKSRGGEKLPMTVPVFQDGGNPMASDPPVFDDAVEGGWRVRFVMPEGRSAADLPPPPTGIAIVELPERRVGAVRFSGVADDDKLLANEDALRGWLERHGEKALPTEPEYAFYNSPMIPPPLRRNEVLLALS
ncbi:MULTISPECIES: SOUL family heme-binding protein [Sphingomonas]|uniref:SOUL family heme-binding protein n=1 Tax=Sphingomonas TaxID=13687 RepID=UPI000DEF3709|nr:MULTISPECIES: heme-binding protein [Sphingomonas]